VFWAHPPICIFNAIHSARHKNARLFLDFPNFQLPNDIRRFIVFLCVSLCKKEKLLEMENGIKQQAASAAVTLRPFPRSYPLFYFGKEIQKNPAAASGQESSYF